MLVLSTERVIGSLDDVWVVLREGVPLLQLRAPHVSHEERMKAARCLHTFCKHAGAMLLINNDAQAARKIAARETAAGPTSQGKNLLALGVHWPERALTNGDFTREGLQLCGVSVHSVESAQRAQQLGADYLVFGHIFPTASHFGEEARGLDALREVCEAVTLPVFAIGGINAGNAPACLSVGAHGVAVMSAVWDAPDVGAGTRELCEVLAV